MFKIEITETVLVKTIIGKEWGIIGTKEIPREKSYYEYGKAEPKTRIENVHGYTPEVEKMVYQTRVVLLQTVDNLCLPSVIKAINGIK